MTTEDDTVRKLKRNPNVVEVAKIAADAGNIASKKAFEESLKEQGWTPEELFVEKQKIRDRRDLEEQEKFKSMNNSFDKELYGN